jgi:FkbM family methyltransferase
MKPRQCISRWINRCLAPLSCEIRHTKGPVPPASLHRPVGDIDCFLEDLKARGFVPEGLLDVGAHKGSWTADALRTFPACKAVMIEPQDEMVPYLEEVCARHPGVTHVKAGAGSACEERIQTIWDDFAGSSFLPQENSELLGTGKQRVTRLVTLDSVIQTGPSGFRPDLVKLDVQGYEIAALKGAASLFGKTEVFIVEVSLFRFFEDAPLCREVIQYMAERGYELYDIPGMQRRPLDGALGQLDLAFVKSGGRFRTSSAW